MRKFGVFGCALGVMVLAGCGAPVERVDCATLATIEVERFAGNPIFDKNTDPRLGGNVNGPSVIHAPSWIEEPLGKYYKYFAHHHGDHIKLAYADDPMGPWTLYEPGTLRLEQAPAFYGHIASPDVHVDEETQTLRMYFHGPAKHADFQKTGIAFSDDGLNWKASDTIQGLFYFRVFEHEGWHYAIAKNNNEGFMALYRGKTGIDDWELRGNFLPDARHAAVDVTGDTLHIYYSRVGDAPERIVRSSVDISGDWMEWEPTSFEEVLCPAMPYEGADHRLEPSQYGAAIDVAQLRDPAIFNDGGRKFLFYSGEGEETLNGAIIFPAADGNVVAD